MIRVSSTEFQRNVEPYQDEAVRQPVTVTHRGRDRTVLISTEEYDRLKRRDRTVMGLSDFTDADIAALERSEAPPETAAFDDEMKS